VSERADRTGVEAVGRHWERLGADDPLWAVYVAPGTRGGGWDVEEFLRTGRVEVDAVLDDLSARGIAHRTGTVLDFGCGVGRLSNALARHFDRVLAVDVAPSMLERARRLDRSGGRIDFRHNPHPDLREVPDGEVDVAYSSLVLQHLPRAAALVYLRELVRVTRPGGLVVVQTAPRPRLTPKGVASVLLPPRATAWAQLRLLGYPAPMRMTLLSRRAVRGAVRHAGAELVHVARDDSYGGHWVCERFVLRVTG
jgi:SAM-dependent methyltransferase